MVWYLDTSAFLKLVVEEAETRPLRAWLAGHAPVWSSELLRTEALRAGTRLGVDLDLIEDVLDAVSLVLPSTSTFRTAGRLAPPGLRSLDALHLATANELGGDLDGLVTYDAHMVAGAEALSMTVVAPS